MRKNKKVARTVVTPPRAVRAAPIRRGLNITANETLFVICLIACQSEYGVEPPAELGLPRSIGNVVDYDFVKRMMFASRLRDDDDTEERRTRHRERMKAEIKLARMRLMDAGLIRQYDPFIWLTERAIGGMQCVRSGAEG